MQTGADFVQSKSHHSFWNCRPCGVKCKNTCCFVGVLKDYQFVMFTHAGLELACGVIET